MFQSFNRLFLFFGLFCMGCSSSKNAANSIADLPATALKPIGRYAIDNSHNLELVSSAVHFGFSFEGRECKMYVSLANAGAHNYFQYELDGVYQKKIRVEGNASQPIVLTATNSGKHTIWIYKTTEAHTGPIFIQKITGKNVRALKIPGAPFIEFIGNSITCGAAADPSEVPCRTGVYHDQHNAYEAYGPRVARALGTNYTVSSVSGIGVYRNWNSDGPTMPQVYENIDFQNKTGRQWDFERYAPKIVSIALGTNDFSNGDGIKKRLPFDSTAFVSNYIKFVQLVKSKYPRAQIALLSSPMVQGKNRQALESYLLVVKQQIDKLYQQSKPVALHFFEPMQAHGCSGHPGVEDHAILANQLIPFFSNLL